MDTYTISIESPNTKDAFQLMNELSDTLVSITGDSGRNSFDIKDIDDPRALFVIARNETCEAIGCGAFRPINDHIAEVKRMYTKYTNLGIGTKILLYLEMQAKMLGYTVIWLETRMINEQAISFYLKNGYYKIPNYGKYIGNLQAICFEKYL